MSEEYAEPAPPDYAGLLRLDGRHVLVMGGGQGIGRQACLAMHAAGAEVSVLDVDSERAAGVAAEISGHGVRADVTSAEGLRAGFESATNAFGPLRGLVDVVGAASWGPIAEIDDGTVTQALSLNLRHAFRALRLLAEVADPAGASAVFVSSISGLRSAPEHAAYGAAKAGLHSLVSSAAVELGPRIRVNAVAPGQTRTPRMVARHPDDGYYREAARRVPLGRVGETWDIASALLYFVSDLSAWVTGQILVVDGGAGRRFQYA